jgi:murein DD-endopeptidase MepM/ murein hydrolase activator NlpD
MMRRPALIICLLAVCMALGLGLAATSAQSGNLLRDGDFEGEYTGRGRGDLNIPADWGLWFTEAPRTEAWMNLPPVAFPHRGPDPNPQNGALAMNFNKGFATYTAAIYQQVAVPANANVTGSAFGFLRTCNIPQGADKCGSAVESGAYMRVGIDVRGGTNPLDPGIIWSGQARPHDRWEQMTVTATAQGGTVTLFLFTTQQWPAQLNNAYWDNASLTVGGAGGVAPAGGAPGTPLPPPTATPVPFVPFVNPQNAQADGSIVHVVGSGDTVDSIAFAYGVSRSQILELNNIGEPRLIQIGQRLIIQPAPEAALTQEADPALTAQAESTAEGEFGAGVNFGPATATPVATGQPGAVSGPDMAATRNAFSTVVAATVSAFQGAASTPTPTPTPSPTRRGATTGGGSLLGGAAPTPTLAGALPGQPDTAAQPAPSVQTASHVETLRLRGIASAGVLAAAGQTASAPLFLAEPTAVAFVPLTGAGTGDGGSGTTSASGTLNADGSTNFGPTNPVILNAPEPANVSLSAGTVTRGSLVQAEQPQAAQAAPVAQEAAPVAQAEQPQAAPVAQEAAPVAQAEQPQAAPVVQEAAAVQAEQPQAAPVVQEAAPVQAEQPQAAPPQAEPPQAAPVLSVADGAVQPLVNPAERTARVCASLFTDANSNRVQDVGEAYLAGGTLALTGAAGAVGQHTTDSSGGPYCFDGLAAGEYTVSARVAEPFGLTTLERLNVRAVMGAVINIQFGAAEGVAPIVAPTADRLAETGSAFAALDARPNPFASTTVANNLGIIIMGLGAAVLVAGAGLTLMLRRRE